ncbi:hypothetical protein [Candidatus Poriferisocius sp.]|uniref:hypothetical protein n=1 Tax=Candidatus Poriferisocius sp. TaxID=3101276 RepID=UPI003B023346
MVVLLLAGCSAGVENVLKSSDTEMVISGSGATKLRRGFAAGNYAVCISGSQSSGGIHTKSVKPLSLKVETDAELVAIDGQVETDWASPNHPISVPPGEPLAAFDISADHAIKWILRMEPAESALGCGY